MLDEVKTLLSFLPSNNLERPPTYKSADDPDRECLALDTLLPESPPMCPTT